MNTIKKISSGLNKLETMQQDLSDACIALLKERQDAIINAYRIVELFNDDIFNISNVQFKKPIKVKYISNIDSMKFEEVYVEDVFNCGGLEYGVSGNAKRYDFFEIPLEALTSDSLKKVLNEMEKGIWDVCLLDSDEDFYQISFEELQKRYKIESDKRYNQHCEQ